MRRHVIYGGGHFRLLAGGATFTDVTYAETSSMRRHVIYGERTFSPLRRRRETDVTYVIYAGDVTYADGRRKLLTTEA